MAEEEKNEIKEDVNKADVNKDAASNLKTGDRVPNPHLRKKITLREMTIVGMLGGITMLLGLTGYGFVPLVFMKATILHIPAIIGALMEGPRVGILVGLIFGLFSLFQNIVAPTLMSFAFLNPLVSVLPRLFIGPFAYLIYKLLPLKSWPNVSVAIAAFAGSLFNTVTVLGMIYVLYAAHFAEIRGIAQQDVVNILLGVAIANGLPEALVSAVIVTPIVIMVGKVLKNKNQ